MGDLGNVKTDDKGVATIEIQGEPPASQQQRVDVEGAKFG